MRTRPVAGGSSFQLAQVAATLASTPNTRLAGLALWSITSHRPKYNSARTTRALFMMPAPPQHPRRAR